MNDRFEQLGAKVLSMATFPLLTLVGALTVGSLADVAANPTPLFVFFGVGFAAIGIAYAYQLLKHRSDFVKYFDIPRKERDFIYVAGSFAFLFNAILFTYFQNVAWFFKSMLIVIFLGVFFFVNKYVDKASMHAGAFTFGIVYLVGSYGQLFSLGLIILPLVYWARIKLHKHTWKQLFLGTLLGLFMGLLAWNY